MQLTRADAQRLLSMPACACWIADATHASGLVSTHTGQDTTLDSAVVSKAPNPFKHPHWSQERDLYGLSREGRIRTSFLHLRGWTFLRLYGVHFRHSDRLFNFHFQVGEEVQEGERSFL